jgi:hypothetical protein
MDTNTRIPLARVWTSAIDFCVCTFYPTFFLFLHPGLEAGGAGFFAMEVRFLVFFSCFYGTLCGDIGALRVIGNGILFL